MLSAKDVPLATIDTTTWELSDPMTPAAAPLENPGGPKLAAWWLLPVVGLGLLGAAGRRVRH